MKNKYLLILLLQICFAVAQSPWNSQSWSSAANLTSVMSANGVTELSGLFFNPDNNRLYAVQDDGRLWVMQWNTIANSFTLVANKTLSGGPEGITQVDLAANEFYTIDENNYEIRKYTHAANFSSVTLSRHWDLLADPSPMTDTGNTGPEGIAFVPDSILSSGGFISQANGQPYTSTKGMGGLIFIAHQDGGYIWVFDVNPNVNDDFLYVGKYKTNRTESCEITLDRSTGLLYILHDISGSNKLEVVSLETAALSGGERKFVIENEYFLVNPTDGNENIEGFALTPKCNQTGSVTAWICRDVESDNPLTMRQDVLRMFNPFNSDGFCLPLAGKNFVPDDKLIVAPNPATEQIMIFGIDHGSVQIFNQLGQLVLEKFNVDVGSPIDISYLQQGIYTVEVQASGSISRVKWIKN